MAFLVEKLLDAVEMDLVEVVPTNQMRSFHQIPNLVVATEA